MCKALPVTLCLFMLCNTSVMVLSDATAEDKADSNKNSLVEDIGRGLKSAAKNVGDEIPKIGPAIADTFNKVTGKGGDQGKATKKVPAQKPAKEKHTK